MTTVITRLYADKSTAEAAAADLAGEGFASADIDVIDKADAAAMAEARVAEDAAGAIAAAMPAGAALLVVRAPFSPIGAARRAMEIVDGHPAIETATTARADYIRETPRASHFRPTILEDHPLFMTGGAGAVTRRPEGMIGNSFGFKTIIRRKETPNSARWKGGAILGSVAPLLRKKSGKNSAIAGGQLFTATMGMPMLRAKRR